MNIFPSFKKIPYHIRSNIFIQGGVLLTVASVVGSLLNVVFNFIVGRLLGTTGYGEIAALFSYLTMTSLPVGIVSAFVIQRIGSSQKREEYAHTVERYLWYLLNKWWIIYILALAMIPFAPHFTNLSAHTAYVLIPLAFFSILNSYYAALLTGRRLFVSLTALSILGGLFKLFSIIPVAIGIDGMGAFSSALLFFSIISFFLYRFFFYRNLKQLSSYQPIQIEKKVITLIKNPQFILTSCAIIAVTVYSSLDIIFAQKLLTGHEAGIYSSWSFFGKTVLYAVSPMISVSYVFFSARNEKKSEHRTLVYTLYILTGLSLTGYVTFSLFGKAITSMLFGKTFLDVVIYLPLASIYGFSYATIIFISNYFLAKRHFFALILSLCMPVYALWLFLFGQSVKSFIDISMVFSLGISFLYIAAYIFYFRKQQTVTMIV